jgi:integrase
MAQVAGGGSKAAVMADFNPKETTLRQVIGDYAEASRAKGSKLTGFEDKLFKSKALQTYLDNPVTELFDGHWGDADNPLIKVLNSVGEKSRGGYYSAIASIESNVFRQINRLRFNEEYTKLTDTVARPEKGVKYTSKFGYNPERLGSFHANLVEYVKNNPDSKSVANALLFQLYTGFRPNAAGGLTPLNIQRPQVRGGPHGIFISGSQLGAKGSPINVPLTRRAMAVLQSQETFNENKFGGQQFIFQKKSGKEIKPIDDKDITGLLKKMQKANLIPEGLKVDVTGVSPKSSSNLTAYDLRRLHATTLAFLQVPIEKAAMLTGRVVGGGGEQARYIGVSPGVFNPKGAALDANKLTDYMYQEYSRVVPGGTEAAEKDKKFLSRNRDVFSPNEPIEFVKPETDTFRGTYGQGTKLVQTTDADFIEGDYKVIDDKPPANIAQTSKETQDWFRSMNIDDGSLAPQIEDKSSGASKLIKGVGKKIIPSLTIAAVGSQYLKSKKAGASTLEASVRAGTELLPLSVQDVEDLGAFVKKAREEGLPEAIGLDTEKQKQMNITRKQRLADRVKRNTSVTPPPEEGFINQNEIGRQ